MLRPVRPLSVLLVILVGSHALAQQEGLTLERATRLALQNNPDLRLLAASVDAERAKLAGARLVLQNNPTVTTTAGPRSSPVGESLDYSFQLLQPFEIAGQRGVRIDAAEAALEAAEARLQALRIEVTSKVQEGFGRALAAEMRVQIASEALAIAQGALNAAEERFRAGAAALLEKNTARVELGRATRQRAEAERARGEAHADLHLLIGFDAYQQFAVMGELETGEPLRDPGTLVEEALANRAELQAERRDLDAAMAEARLASREWVPSPRIGASYSREEESDTSIFQGVLGIDLPLFNRNTASRGVAAARVAQTEVSLAATERRIKQEVLTALARVHAAQAAADGYAGDVVKAIQENLELVTESYRAGKIDFLQLVIIRRQAVEAKREHIDVLEELNAAKAQLNRALGRGR